MRKCEMWTEWKSIFFQNPKESYFVIYLLLIPFFHQNVFETANGEDQGNESRLLSWLFLGL